MSQSFVRLSSTEAYLHSSASSQPVAITSPPAIASPTPVSSPRPSRLPPISTSTAHPKKSSGAALWLGEDEPPVTIAAAPSPIDPVSAIHQVPNTTPVASNAKDSSTDCTKQHQGHLMERKRGASPSGSEESSTRTRRRRIDDDYASHGEPRGHTPLSGDYDIQHDRRDLTDRDDSRSHPLRDHSSHRSEKTPSSHEGKSSPQQESSHTAHAKNSGHVPSDLLSLCSQLFVSNLPPDASLQDVREFSNSFDGKSQTTRLLYFHSLV